MLLQTICVLSFLVYSTLAFYSSSDGVTELTPSNFDNLVVQDEAVWVVEFYAPWCGHCQNLVPEYKKLANAAKGVFKVGAVNADENKSLAQQYGVRAFPTIKIFGVNKQSPVAFDGSRTARAMADSAINEIRKKISKVLGGGDSSSSSSEGSDESDVIELTDDNFNRLVLESEDDWLVEFFAPWCGHCKNLAPHWAKAAKELKGKVKLGALDATVHQSKATEYGVRGYPTIKYFPAGKKSSRDSQEYDGGRTSSDIVSWALDKHVANVPPPELVEIIDEKSFDEACESKSLCAISVLPHILDCDANCRNKFIQILKSMGEKYKQKMWGWAWTEAGAQLELESSLDIGGFGYPAMAMVNFKKMKFSMLRGSFSYDGINEFLRDISFGRGQTAPVKGAKKPVINTNEPWDGKDGQLPTEEEYDLSDVDLDEEPGNEKDEL